MFWISGLNPKSDLLQLAKDTFILADIIEPNAFATFPYWVLSSDSVSNEPLFTIKQAVFQYIGLKCVARYSVWIPTNEYASACILEKLSIISYISIRFRLSFT